MSQKIVSGNCWIAYFDLLGFRSFLNDVSGHVDCVAKYYEEIITSMDKDVENWRDSADVIWASDSFVFYTFDDSPLSFTIINMVAQHFFVRQIWKRSPLRGALTSGEFYVDKNKKIYLGLGFVDAYEYAEKQNWLGLVLTPKAQEKLKKSKLSDSLANGGLNFLEYNVPIAKKEAEEQLYAFKMTCYDCDGSNLTENCIKEMMCSAKNKYVITKYENTLNFIQCS